MKNIYDNLDYKTILNLPKDLLFGTELEFSDALYDDVKGMLDVYENNNKFIGYKLSYDETVVKIIDSIAFGGEIKTPILSDNIKTWKDIKQLCSSLRKLGSYTNINCGQHIHFDINIFKDNPQYIINFFKLWAVFEDIIYMFSCGEDNTLRNNINIYCREVGRDIFILLTTSSSNNKSKLDLCKIIKKSYSYLSKENAIRFSNFNTMEIRVCKGTLNHIIIQNNILFFSKLLLYSCSNKFDEGLINSLFKNYDKSTRVFEKYKNIDIERAKLLTNLIYDDEKDKLQFLKQYLKEFSKKDEKILIK